MLIEHLKETGVLRSAPIEHALREVDRADFVPDDLRSETYEDTALPIGGGQTISQPYTVVFMLEKLNVTEGSRVLDVGYGSGWQTALIAHLVGEQGWVEAFEIVPELCQFGIENLKKYPELAYRVKLNCESAERGSLTETSFDRIISAAEVTDVPAAWRKQLAFGGSMIYPQASSLVLESKSPDGSFAKKQFAGFVFVPFVSR